MTIDQITLLFLWILFPLLLLIFVPKDRIRELIAVFLLFHALTWSFSIVLTHYGLLQAGTLEFPHATKINFSLEYIVYPSIAVFFQLWFPEHRCRRLKALYYLCFVLLILSIIILVSIFTNLIFLTVSGMISSFFNFLIEFVLCRKFIQWFLRGDLILESRSGYEYK